MQSKERIFEKFSLRDVIGRYVLLVMFVILYSGCIRLQAQGSNYLLWYSRPASNWNEALPIGNGRLGAMVFGDVNKERIQLNEGSVWTGKRSDFVNPEAKEALPVIRKLLFEERYSEAQQLAQEKMMGNKKIHSTYQTLGDLYLDFQSGLLEESYQRSLNLETAVAAVQYKSNNTNYTREYFSSAPDQAIVIRLTASETASLSFAAHLSRPGNKATYAFENNELVMREHVGDGVGVRIVARLKILNEGGNISYTDRRIRIDKANAVTILVTAATDYKETDPDSVSEVHLKAVASKLYDVIKSDHIKDYQEYFKRVDFFLAGDNKNNLPTDERLTAFKNGGNDPGLLTLYYQFGRYLLISSSRPGGLPANLQGIWADGLTPPWDADYHININIQMNYWPSEITNLSEMHLPFLSFIDSLRKDGIKTARDIYGVKGSTAHFTSDVWHFTEPYGQVEWAMWPMGFAWCSLHAWEHYRFTEDNHFLKTQGYTILKAAAEFSMNYLTQDPKTKKLVSGPSISPENSFKTNGGNTATLVMGPTMDHMIIRQVLSNTIQASKVLNVDAAFRKQMESMLSKLTKTKIARDGRIMEWSAELEEAEPGHRHISHLFGLYPGTEINRNTPELQRAARNTIDYRLAHGGGHTGWSRAWIINFFARLQDGNKAYENLVALLQKSTLPNLFDNHPPFQIDGNFGATAGITEMLLQSHTDEVELLPALPDAWKEGSITGICAHGGFEITMNWKNGTLESVSVLSKLGNLLRLRYKNKTIKVATQKNSVSRFNGQLKSITN